MQCGLIAVSRFGASNRLERRSAARVGPDVAMFTHRNNWLTLPIMRSGGDAETFVQKTWVPESLIVALIRGKRLEIGT